MEKARRITASALLLIISFITIFGFTAVITEQTNTEVLSKYGSRGSEVTEIQTRLKRWGYYNGSVDGIYGTQTKNAVIYFQKKNGLTADGIAGPRTLAAIGISSSSSSSSGGSGKYSQSEVRLLARMISAESRGESYSGQVAVGAVILNRVEHPSFPNTISGVCYQPGAFTALQDGQFNVSVADSAYRAADAAINGWDPSGGAIYYYNPATAKNQWIRSRPVVARIGKHVFCL